MGPFDIAVIVVLSVAVLAVIGTVIYRKVKHKGSGCGCGCDSCSACDKCRDKDNF